MKEKTFTLYNLKETDVITITSEGQIIDFVENNLYVAVYFDGAKKPDNVIYSHKYVSDNIKRKHNKSFELQIKGETAIVKIRAVTDFDVNKVICPQ
jgi:hypothetical protein